MEQQQLDDALLTRESLRNRLRNLIMIYDSTIETDYPRPYVLLGYGTLFLNSRKEILYRIKELCELLRLNLEEIQNERGGGQLQF